MTQLNKIFDEAYQKVRKTGLTEHENSDYFLNRFTLNKSVKNKHNILVVDCNHEVLEQLSSILNKELHVNVNILYIQDIKKNPEQFLDIMNQQDLIVCGMNHIEEIRQAVPEIKKEIFGIILNPDFKNCKQNNAASKGH